MPWPCALFVHDPDGHRPGGKIRLKGRKRKPVTLYQSIGSKLNREKQPWNNWLRNSRIVHPPSAAVILDSLLVAQCRNHLKMLPLTLMLVNCPTLSKLIPVSISSKELPNLIHNSIVSIINDLWWRWSKSKSEKKTNRIQIITKKLAKSVYQSLIHQIINPTISNCDMNKYNKTSWPVVTRKMFHNNLIPAGFRKTRFINPIQTKNFNFIATVIIVKSGKSAWFDVHGHEQWCRLVVTELVNCPVK